MTMTDQEMEMTVDFGQPGFGEDIDIDLDFPAGQPDEDMDLEDFDRVHDIHNFNSDTRDELMAEGDDLSYNMIDAIESDPNASAVAANDIDIELEHAVDNIWQHNLPHTTDFNLDVEIDYLDETTVETMDAERNDADVSEWVPAVMISHDANEIVDANGEHEDIFTGAQGPFEVSVLENSTLPTGEPSESAQPPNPEAEATYPPAASSPNKQSTHVTDVHSIPEAVSQNLDQPPVVDGDEDNPGQATAGTEDQSHSPKIKSPKSDEQLEVDQVNETAEAGLDYADEIFVSHSTEQIEQTEVTELESLKEDHAGLPQPEEADEVADDALEYQLGGDSYLETTNDQTGVDDTQVESAAGRSESQSVATNPPNDLESCQNDVAPTADIESLAVEVGERDDPVELADHYDVYISYGETNYRLFAKSKDDDPNQYFLADTSVLEVSLTQFLASLRDVISEEVSPLDDLVMQVDGLGLEFSESTTPDFLGKFTFGDLIVLYDKLVKNEQAGSSPPIHTYLTVRPNCNRRMMALGESANAGRGLSEVALYHDSVDEDQANDVGSPDTNISTVDYNDGESGSIYPQEDYENGDAVDEDGENDSQSPSAKVQSEHAPDPDEETDEAGRDKEEAPVSVSTNEIDHEEDDSISKQDHATSDSSELQPQETDGREHQISSEISEAGQLQLQEPKALSIKPTDASNSENTSVTATLDGEDRDEIDYNSDEDTESNHQDIDVPNKQTQSPGTVLEVKLPVDDEITWESDDEEPNVEIKGGLPSDTVQVSPVSGKRTRADSDTLDGAGDKKDNKRRRS